MASPTINHRYPLSHTPMPSLNPEPSSPSQRAAAHLPPKSYVDAAEETPSTPNNHYPSQSHNISHSQTHNPTHAHSPILGHQLSNVHEEDEVDETSVKETPPRHERQMSEPRALGEILDEDDQHSLKEQSAQPATPSRNASRKSASGSGSGSANGMSYADAAHEGLDQGRNPQLQHRRFDVESEGDEEGELVGEGRDESPRTPLRREHRRVPSRGSGSNSSGSGSGTRKPDGVGSPRGKRSGKGEAREVGEMGQNKLIYEKVNGETGESLTSVKPSEVYEEGLRQDKLEQKQQRRSELASGRQAGKGWEQSAIRWAPLNVPIQRRLQTLVVLGHTLCIAFFLALFFLLCAIPLLWPILIPYLIYILISKAGSNGTLVHRSERLRRLPIWSLFASYFPARLHRSQELAPTRKYIFGYHPHGIISHGAFAAFGTEALGFSQLFPGIMNTLLTLDSNFRIPLYRDYALRMGLASVSRESCENILSQGGRNGEGMGRAITIVIGGARESLDAQPDSLRLVLKRRKGFVKLAIRTGADLVPVLAFGENELYDQFDPKGHPFIHKAQMLAKKMLGFTVPLFHARGVFNYDVGMMPYRRPLNVVVGRPIMVERQERPDPGYVDEIHERYTQELIAVWDEWKDVFAKSRNGELEIVE